ncbi:hypothetical protein IDJ77_03725 [Mucilaginibacter sp. ZT4R22]|uniref:Uncharacterized protein n=1 Tax=Mucilaginibacter pankratovii TaxID=2772110 RepID=A0ABR7WKQ7_9SPHI|nr:hypothetical protein [Mucilaginibacter pankratovii]MBD1362909.1 hypothetical protein [Mucilaginibacter pankratovii]
MGLLSRHKKEKEEADLFYKGIGQLSCPYFAKPVVFNSDGFHHLQFSDSGEREKPSQLLKFDLLRLVPGVVTKSGTEQEYRRQWCKVGRKKANGSQDMREMAFWGFVAIVRNKGGYVKIKIILRRIGDGNIAFWSVMQLALLTLCWP